MIKFFKKPILFFSYLILTLNTSNGQEISKIDFEDIKYRNVGPTRGGRSTSVCGVINEQFTFYMGTTGGGLWKTTDAGLKWKNISDGYFKSPSIGSIDVYQADPNIIYVGTGSDGIRSNIIVGKGIYKSIDAGASWEFVGLKNTGQIGAVKINPNNHKIVYAAAIGIPFSPNSERGLYKTTDGGETWKKILFISDKIGIVDIEFSPENPDIIYAASWEVNRKPWTIVSGSKEGGIYKSIDAGKDCTRLSAQAKLVTTETLKTITEQGMQIMASAGYAAESDMQRYWRDARLYTFGEGSSEILLDLIAQDIGVGRGI